MRSNQFTHLFGKSLALIFVATAIAAGQSGFEPTRGQTSRQLAHGRLYHSHEQGTPRLGIDSNVAMIQMIQFIGEPQTLNEFVAARACAANAVVVGTISDKTPALTPQGRFIFTDYTVAITDVFKPNSHNELTIGDSIIVTRAGGELRQKGQLLKAVDESRLALDVGSTYLLFLKYLPETQDYWSDDPLGAFLVQYSRPSAMTKVYLPTPMDTLSTREFMDAVRVLATISNCPR